jgi:nucleoside-diphosphate-sugar epimerase
MLDGSVCLVTGGAGTIGSTIVDQLLEAGAAEVRVLDNLVRGRVENLTEAMRSGRVDLIKGDIRDVDDVRRATSGVDVVFHQAAIRITQCAEEPRLALEVLADGTFNVLEAAVADVALDQLHSRVGQGGGQVGPPTADQVVEDSDTADVGLQKLVDDGGTDGSRTAGHQRRGPPQGSHVHTPVDRKG